MGIPFWKSIGFFVVVLWLSLRLFPTDRELGMYYASVEGFDAARFYLAKQFYRNPSDWPNSVRYLKSLGAAGNVREFENAMQRLYRLQKNRLKLHELAAEFYSGLEEYEEASRHWLAILRLDPAQKDARGRFVSFCLLNGHKDRLIELYSDEIKRGVAWTETYYELGRLYCLRHEAALAEAVYAKLLQKSPKEVSARTRLIDIDSYRGDGGKVLALYRELLALEPANEKFALGYAEALMKYEQWSEASDFIAQAMRKFPGNPRLVYLLVDAMMKTGKKKEALGILEGLRAEGKIRLNALKVMAEIYYEKGDYSKAREMLREYHEKTGGDYRSHHVLGDVLTRLGDKGGGKREYEEALRLLRN
jgi:predicted Zn-dependent protease